MKVTATKAVTRGAENVLHRTFRNNYQALAGKTGPARLRKEKQKGQWIERREGMQLGSIRKLRVICIYGESKGRRPTPLTLSEQGSGTEAHEWRPGEIRASYLAGMKWWSRKGPLKSFVALGL